MQFIKFYNAYVNTATIRCMQHHYQDAGKGMYFPAVNILTDQRVDVIYALSNSRYSMEDAMKEAKLLLRAAVEELK